MVSKQSHSEVAMLARCSIWLSRRSAPSNKETKPRPWASLLELTRLRVRDPGIRMAAQDLYEAAAAVHKRAGAVSSIFACGGC